MAKTTLDARGLGCPLPVLRANKALGDLPSGDIIEILASDPGTAADFAAFCQNTGHQLIDSSDDDGIFTFVIRKK